MTECWIITEGMAGTENQCLGVAEALNIKPVIKRIKLRQPWKIFSPFLGFEQSYSFDPSIDSPWPDLLIASGRKSIAAARYIKKHSKKTFTVQIQDPCISPKYFDLVALPEHDPTRGDNVITTCAAPNRITEKRLAKAREQFAETLSTLPNPKVAVLIGGNSNAHTMSEEITRNLCSHLVNLANNGAGLMVTASRRTGDTNQKILQESLKDSGAYIWDGKWENPYFGILAWADYILVTEDSVSMVSEAATTGKPVYLIPLEGGTKRFNKFHNHLIDKGIIRRFEGSLDKWDYDPLNDAKIIAAEINKRMNI
jgi:mitochondrial fission protein ELM1